MAAFVCIAYSLVVDVYQVGVVFVQSGCSVGKCINYIKDIREDLLAKRYLECIDRSYDRSANENYCQLNGVQCVNCRGQRKQKTDDKMMICEGCNEVEGFVAVERAEEAFEIISNQV